MSSAKDRLIQFIDKKSISRREFCRQIDVSSAFLANNSEIATDKLLNIFNKYPELNLDWLITGKGDMLRSTNTPKSSVENCFSGLTDEEIEEVLSQKFAKHLLEMYESGRAYPASLVTRMIAEKDEKLNEAQQDIGKLKEQINAKHGL